MVNAASVVKFLCAHNGSMEFNQLVSSFRSSDIFADLLYDSVENVIEDSDLFAVVWLNGQKTVVCKSTVKLCRAKDCNGCSNLHLCKFFLFGDCPFGRGRRSCRFSHDLTSALNTRVLQKHSLSQLDRTDLCVLLLQSDNTLLPPVCHSYNNGTGLYGRCPDGESCKRLHICEKYLRGPCQCPRAHDFYEPHPLKTLQDRGVPQGLMGSMKTVYTNIEALRSIRNDKFPQKIAEKTTDERQRQPSSAYANATGSGGQLPSVSSEKTEICLYFVKGSCKFGVKCKREHSKLPYKWEEKTACGWVALSDNEGIERDYCNPAKTKSATVDFDTMTSGFCSVRRLSTVSSVVQPNFILTTTWSWYWEDEYGRWIKYASSNGGHNTASITSEDLEKKYIQDSKATIEFTAGSQSYTLSFQDMIQTNNRYGTKKLVKRRPEFVSSADAQTIRTSKTGPNRQVDFKTLPSHWDKALTPEVGYKRVKLQSSSSEYQGIQNLFNATMRGFSILKIERIQNKALWEVFQWQRDLMRKNKTNGNVAERQLFHGTDSKYLDAICLNNFDWRICGTHGTAFGKGSYFARDAKYSHSYTGDSLTRCMFVCRILVGDYTVGDSSYVRPPSKDGGDTIFYDSCVNDQYNPSIYVVFEKHQIYPEYLITYRDASLSTQPAPYVSISRPAPAPVQAPRPQPQPSYSYYVPAPAPAPPPTKQPKSDSCIIC